jgi:hypothetical protein
VQALAQRRDGSDGSLHLKLRPAGKEDPPGRLGEARPEVQRRHVEGGGVSGAHMLRLQAISPREGNGWEER